MKVKCNNCNLIIKVDNSMEWSFIRCPRCDAIIDDEPPWDKIEKDHPEYFAKMKCRNEHGDHCQYYNIEYRNGKWHFGCTLEKCIWENEK